MGSGFSAHTVVSAAAVLLSGAAAYVAWRRREAPGAQWLLWMMLATAAWAFAQGSVNAVVAPDARMLWGHASYLGATTAPVFLFLFACVYSGRARLLTTGRIALLFVIPFLSIAAAFYQGWDQITWPGFTTLPGYPNAIVYQHGLLYWLVLLYCTAVGLAGTTMLVAIALRAWPLHRNQSVVAIAAVLLPWVTQGLYILVPGRLPSVDPPITLAVTGTVLTVTMLSPKLLDLVPVAREVLIDEMADGLIVLDQSELILEVNPAAVRILGLPKAPAPGCRAIDLFREWPNPEDQKARFAEAEVDDEVRFLSPSGVYIGVTRTTLREGGGTVRRDIFMLRDMTDQVYAEQALQEAYENLRLRLTEIEQLQTELREQATRDPLTGLHNRRYLSESLERELGRASREKYPVSLVMFDIDDFKEINDTYGHAAGDRILQVVASEVRAHSRLGDMVCRYGGDEFLVVLPNTTADSAAYRARRWLETIREASAGVIDDVFETTASFGVAAFPTHGETVDGLIAAADSAVYVSKAEGRNRVSIAYAPKKPPGMGTA